MQTTVQSTALVRTVGKQQTRLMARASSELNGVGQELRVKIKTLDDGTKRAMDSLCCCENGCREMSGERRA